MTARIEISGLGRIGRLVLRTTLEHHKNGLRVVAVNDMANLKTTRICFVVSTDFRGNSASSIVDGLPLGMTTSGLQ